MMSCVCGFSILVFCVSVEFEVLPIVVDVMLAMLQMLLCELSWLVQQHCCYYVYYVMDLCNLLSASFCKVHSQKRFEKPPLALLKGIILYRLYDIFIAIINNG